MKLHLATTLIAGALLGPPPASAQSAMEPPRITVSGSAVIRVVPDEVNLTLGIETREKTVLATRAENERRTAAVVGMLKQSGIPPEDIQTDRVSVAPQYDRYDSLNLTHYVMRQNVAFKLKDLAEFTGLLMSALENGASHVDHVEFLASEHRKHRDEARAQALRAAREKATAMAAELGVKPGKVLSITEEATRYWPAQRSPANFTANSVALAGSGLPESDGGLAVGMIAVTADVTVTFALE